MKPTSERRVIKDNKVFVKVELQRIAQVFRVNRPRETVMDTSYRSRFNMWRGLLDDMCIELQAMNPRFDEARFRAACKKGQQDVC
jgi:hypothetical protein